MTLAVYDGAKQVNGVRVAVRDPVPVYRQGLIGALRDRGFTAEDPEDVEAWVEGEGPRSVVLTLATPADTVILRRLRAKSSLIPIVALLPEPTPIPMSYADALRAGASSAVAWQTGSETIISVLEAALRSGCLLPLPVAQALVHSGRGATVAPVAVAECECDWLHMLANGCTVGDVARWAGYSEREMFRLLRKLYKRMGVRSRAESLVKAAQWGLLQ